MSPNSLGNTVSLDWNVSQAYILDARPIRGSGPPLPPGRDRRRRRSRPGPGQVSMCVMPGNGRDFVALVYRPFLDRHGIDFDPFLLTNRAESVDPDAGWNPSWALHRQRFRVLLVANTVNGLASAIVERRAVDFRAPSYSTCRNGC